MAYRIDGTVSDDSKIYVINTSNDTIEQVKSVSAGPYYVNLLDEENVHVMAVRTSDNKVLGYGAVDALYEYNDYSDTFVVATGKDDGLSYGSNWYNDEGTGFSLGNSTSRLLVARFTNISIPQGAQVEAANFRLVYSENNSTAIPINIRTINEDNSPQRWTDDPWGTPSNWEALNFTSGVSDTFQANQSVGTVWNSTSLVNMIQTIINRPGWSQNNALTIVTKATSSLGTTQNFRQYDYNSGALPPSLYVEWRA